MTDVNTGKSAPTSGQGNVLTLTVSHHIFLTPEEGKTLSDGKPIEVVGYSVPVWFFKGNTSEPAGEVFCVYTLTNQPDDYPIKTLNKGYKINLPQLASDKTVPKPSKEDWDKMNLSEQFEWLKENPTTFSGRDLTSLEENEIVMFRRYNRITENGRRSNAIHIVEIGTMQLLEQSLSRC